MRRWNSIVPWLLASLFLGFGWTASAEPHARLIGATVSADQHGEYASPTFGGDYKEWKPKYDETVKYFETFSWFGVQASKGVIQTIQYIREYRASLSKLAAPSPEQRELTVFLDHALQWIYDNKEKLRKLRTFKSIKAGIRDRGLMLARYLIEKGEAQWDALEKNLFAALDSISSEEDGHGIHREELKNTVFDDESFLRLLRVMGGAKVASNP